MLRRLTDEDARSTMLAAGLKPLEPYSRACVPWVCECSSCGARVFPTLNGVQQGRLGCWPCGIRKRSASRVLNNQDTAIKTMLAANLEPLEPYPGSSMPWMCRCMLCGSSVFPRHSNVKQGRGGCRSCGNIKSSIAQRLASENAGTIMATAGALPLEPYPGSGVRWKCECIKCHRIIHPRLGNVSKGIGACKYCGGIAIDPENAVIEAKAAGLQPLEPYPGGNNAPWKCKCLRCSSIIFPKYHNIRGKSFPCSYCSPGGNPGPLQPALVYLITNLEYSAIKIGIGALGKFRLKKHQRYGWNPVRIWDREITGSVAFSAESRVLRNWRQADIPVACTKEQMPQGGWTETAPLDMVDIAKVRRWVNYEIRKSR